MNMHVNRKRVAQVVIDTTLFRDKFKVVEQDHMPKEVATELLCSLKARTTNRERKTWNHARFTVYESTLRPIPEEQKTSVWMQSRNWMQLHQMLSRAITGRTKAQQYFVFLTRQVEKLDTTRKDTPIRKAILERQLSVLDLHAAGLDALREAVENEIERREKFCAHLQTLAPSVAKKLRRQLCGYAAK